MTCLGIWNLRENFEEYRQGVIVFRNLRSWAKEKREHLIKLASEIPRAFSPSVDSSNRQVSASTENARKSATVSEPEDFDDTPQQDQVSRNKFHGQHGLFESTLAELSESADDQIVGSLESNLPVGLHLSTKHRLSPTNSDTESDPLVVTTRTARPVKPVKRSARESQSTNPSN